ncbi:MAG: DUF1361 domain-containing protein [Candidatus Promineifilaceae bacterium]
MKKQFLLILTIHVITSGLSIALLALRIIRVEAGYFLFLAWNLFLAWMPFLFATAAYAVRRNGRAALGFGLLWLLFLPNAPYILTDLIHLRWVEGAPIWYDLSMFLCFSLAGLLLGLTSLNLMQTLVMERFGRFVSWLFVIVSMSLAGYGVYIGRFLRWNSWDIITSPFGLAGDILSMLRHPIQHIDGYFTSAVFAAIFLLGYITIISIGSMQKGIVSK